MKRESDYQLTAWVDLRPGQCILPMLLLLLVGSCCDAESLPRYYAHDAVEDKHGVIYPWYKEQNGPWDLRIRIAAETLKRYPWSGNSKAPTSLPEFLWNGKWNTSDEGQITIPPLSAWEDGDRVQRVCFVIFGFIDYYRYTGDPAALAHVSLAADYLLDYCRTDAQHEWPSFIVSAPTKGKPYGQVDPTGHIQLDSAAEAGLALLRAYQFAGNSRWLDAAKHWGDLLATRCDRTPGKMPWPRFANPQNVSWQDDNKMTGGIVYILYFLDELIRLGYTGKDNSIVTARDAGRAYLRDVLLEKWTEIDTWGRHFWDWPCVTPCLYVTSQACRYIMDNKDYFSNWRNDVRNILGIYLNYVCAYTNSRSGVYSGAWQLAESNSCCDTSLWYSSLELAMVYAQYGVQADSEWGREVARRMQIMTSYDIRENGISDDNILGGQIVNANWFKIAHPMALKHVLMSLSWMPAVYGANRENHIVRSSSVVNFVVYGDKCVSFSTFDAPKNTITVLRLACVPTVVKANQSVLARRSKLDAVGYTVDSLGNGDCIVAIRHDGSTRVVVEGRYPLSGADHSKFDFEGDWHTTAKSNAVGGSVARSNTAGSSATFTFTGNQIRILGWVDDQGGLADVYIDGVKQICGIDFWCPQARGKQVVYYRSGLPNKRHTVKIVVKGEGNDRSSGSNVYLDAAQWSDATGGSDFASGSGPTSVQRMVFGCTERCGITDSSGNVWLPGLEWITRLGTWANVVEKAWWTEPAKEILNTTDSSLYRYGIHGREILINVTVGPGKYYARLKFASTRGADPRYKAMSILINGKERITNLDVLATAGGENKAFDLVFEDIEPVNGMVSICLVGSGGPESEAFIQALEVGQGYAGEGVVPIVL